MKTYYPDGINHLLYHKASHARVSRQPREYIGANGSGSFFNQ